MKGIKILGYVLLALLFISTVPYAAEAGSVKIYPHQFKPVTPGNTNGYQTHSTLGSLGGSAGFSAAVQLPVGRRVTRLVAYISRNAASGTTNEVSLWRFQFGAADPYERIMAILYVYGETGNEAVKYEETSIEYSKVKSGYLYYVYAHVGTNGRVHGVKVVYE